MTSPAHTHLHCTGYRAPTCMICDALLCSCAARLVRPEVPICSAGAQPNFICQRCPSLSSASDYTILLVPQSAKRLHRSGALHLLALSTQDVTPPTFVIPPYITNITVNTFTLNVELDEPGGTRFWTKNAHGDSISTGP